MVSFTVQGLVPPVFTAFNDDYSVNYGIIPTYAKYLVDSGIKAVLVGGTTGEHMALPIEERKKLIADWVKVGKSLGLHIMAQIGGTAFPDVIELAKYCEKVGVDSLLTLPELYFKPATVDDLIFYFEQISKATPKLPLLYYHIPHMSNVELDMPAFVAAAIARVPNFKGIKFSDNDLSMAAQVLRTLKDGQQIFLGADGLLAPAELLGIRSSICTTFNQFPRLAAEILQTVENKDFEKARALQEKLSKAVEAHVVEGEWVPIMKAGMEIVTGFKMGPPALPQRPISAEAKQRIQTKLKALGLAK